MYMSKLHFTFDHLSRAITLPINRLNFTFYNSIHGMYTKCIKNIRPSEGGGSVYREMEKRQRESILIFFLKESD